MLSELPNQSGVIAETPLPVWDLLTGTLQIIGDEAFFVTTTPSGEGMVVVRDSRYRVLDIYETTHWTGKTSLETKKDIWENHYPQISARYEIVQEEGKDPILYLRDK